MFRINTYLNAFLNITYIYYILPLKMERDEEECSNTRCELYINKIETKISLHRVSCEDHNHQGLT